MNTSSRSILLSRCQHSFVYKDHNAMMTNGFAAEHIDTPTRCAERDATSQHHSIFNCKAFGINSGEVIDRSNALKL